MTDSKTVVEDLAAWLGRVWDEDQARLSDPTFCGPVWPTTAQLLAWIAADRKILALHRHVTDPAGWIDCIACGEQGRAPGDVAYAFCEHVRLLASPYADRPGFRPEWLVERQGVEG